VITLAKHRRYIARTMSKLLLPLAILIAAASLTGCSLWNKDKKPKSSARLYDGDTSPNIHYSDEPESAGGPINPY
jgi:hypothetical protein